MQFLIVSAMMNQVCNLARMARVGWVGFDLDPPTREDCIKAIEDLDPAYKGIRDVITFFCVIPISPINPILQESHKSAILGIVQELYYFTGSFY